MVPQNTSTQRAVLLSASPSYKIQTDSQGNRYITFVWNHPASKVLTYNVTWLVFVDSDAGFDSGLLRKRDYLVVDNLTQWTPYMREKAKSLVTGRDPLENIGLISLWVTHNLHYNKSEAGVSLPASQVFRERRGVCDEYAYLLISLLRSIGMPVRYVEGLVYTGESWDRHAWAEVYIGGWIPVDPTYSEVGGVDATHVVLAKTSSDYLIHNIVHWRGRSARVSFGESDHAVVVENRSASTPLPISLKCPKTIGESAVVNLTATITNILDSPTVVSCSLNMPRDMLLLDYRKKSVFLKKGEKSDISWKIASPSGLKKRFLHIMPVQITCFPLANATCKITVDPRQASPKHASAVIRDFTVLNQTSVYVVVQNDGTMPLPYINITLYTNKTEVLATKTLYSIPPGDFREVVLSIPAPSNHRLFVNISAPQISSTPLKTTTLPKENKTLESPEVSENRTSFQSQISAQNPHTPPPKRAEKSLEFITLVLVLFVVVSVVLIVFLSVLKTH